MMEKRSYRLVHAEARRRAIDDVRTAPEGYAVVVQEATRSLDQNAAQWPILQAFADQLQMNVNDEMCWVTKEEWKDTLTAIFEKEAVRVAEFEGRKILLGQRTSQFGKKKFSDWLDFLHAMAAAKDVDLHYLECA